MGKIKVRYLVVKRQKGHPLFYWQPNKALRDAGFLPRRLRRTAVVRLAEAGCSVPEIAAISGHSINRTAQILEVYCPRTSTMAGNAITKLEDYRRTLSERKLEA